MGRTNRTRARIIAVALCLFLALVPTSPSWAQGDDRLFVTNNGKGAALRRAPGESNRVGVDAGAVHLPDGTPLRQTGPDQAVEGIVWKQVEARVGDETHRGWIRADLTSRTRPRLRPAVPDQGSQDQTPPATPKPRVDLPPEEARRVTEQAVSQGRIPAAVANATLGGSTARVIVELRVVAYRPEPTLPGTAAVNAQRATIQSAQANVLSQVSGPRANAAIRYETIPFVALEVDAAELAILLRSPDVAAITEDRQVDIVGVTVPEVRPQLAQSAPLIDADDLWGAGFTGAGQTVAILDTGVQKTHTFLTGKVVSEACFSTTSAPSSTTSVCPGGVASSTAVDSGVNCPSTTAGCDHGTHVAGIAAGTSATFSGVARGASVIAVQVFSQRNSASLCAQSGFPSPCTTAFFSNINQGLERVFALRTTFTIAAVNMSLGGGQFFDQATCDANNASTKAIIDNLRAANIATVISSGNSGFTNSMGAPGCISTAVSVGSTTKADAVSSFSNSVSFLNLLAPGSDINSSVLVPANGFASFNGTSMAAPHVTGAWALFKHKNPSATVTQALNAFTTTGQPILDDRNGITRPRIKVAAAANSIGQNGPANDMFAQPTVVTTLPSNFDIPSTANATVEAGEITNVTCGGSPMPLGRSVWYRYTAATATTLTVSTAGSNFDTTLIASTNTTLPTFLTGAICNDDAVPGAVFTSSLTIPVTAGQTWVFQIGGFDDGTGPDSGNLKVSFTGTAPARTLTVTKIGTGTVTSNPAGIDCGADCTENYADGTTVALTATPGAGQGFSHFSGDCASFSPSCNVPMTANRTVAATFVNCTPRPELDISVTKGAGGLLNINVTGAAGSIKSVQFTLTNARVSVVGGPTNQTSNFIHVPTSPTTQVSLTLGRVIPAGAADARMAVTDACGVWNTLGGAGNNPLNWTP